MDIVNEYSNVGQTDIDSGFTTLDTQRRGFHSVSHIFGRLDPGRLPGGGAAASADF